VEIYVNPCTTNLANIMLCMLMIPLVIFYSSQLYDMCLILLCNTLKYLIYEIMMSYVHISKTYHLPYTFFKLFSKLVLQCVPLHEHHCFRSAAKASTSKATASAHAARSSHAISRIKTITRLHHLPHHIRHVQLVHLFVNLVKK